MFQVSRRLVDKVAQKGASPITRPGPERVVATEELTEEFLNRVCEDPHKSIRTHAADMGISKDTIRKMATDLGLISATLISVPLVTKLQEKKRLERAELLLGDMESRHPDTVYFFSDECQFTVDPHINRKNDRVLVREYDDPLRYVTKSKHPASAMYLGVIASTGHTNGIWVEDSGRLNAEGYRELLKKGGILEWMKGVARGRPFVFQQDGAPPHTAHSTQEFLERELGPDSFWRGNQWPPSSPDLNPLDYWAWAEVKAHACKQRHSSVAAMKAAVNEAWMRLPRAQVQAACAAFPRRLRKVVEAAGGHFEK